MMNKWTRNYNNTGPVIMSHIRCDLESKFSEFDTLAESDPEDDADIIKSYQACNSSRDLFFI